MKIKINTDKKTVRFYGRPEFELVLSVCEALFPGDDTVNVSQKVYLAHSSGDVKGYINPISLKDCKKTRAAIPAIDAYNLLTQSA